MGIGPAHRKIERAADAKRRADPSLTKLAAEMMVCSEQPALYKRYCQESTQPYEPLEHPLEARRVFLHELARTAPEVLDDLRSCLGARGTISVRALTRWAKKWRITDAILIDWCTESARASRTKTPNTQPLVVAYAVPKRQRETFGGVNAEDGSTPIWPDPRFESLADFKKRAVQLWQQRRVAIDAAIARGRSHRVYRPKPRAHYRWLIRRHVQRWSKNQLLKSENHALYAWEAILKSIARAAVTVGLTLK